MPSEILKKTQTLIQELGSAPGGDMLSAALRRVEQLDDAQIEELLHDLDADVRRAVQRRAIAQVLVRSILLVGKVAGKFL